MLETMSDKNGSNFLCLYSVCSLNPSRTSVSRFRLTRWDSEIPSTFSSALAFSMTSSQLLLLLPTAKLSLKASPSSWGASSSATTSSSTPILDISLTRSRRFLLRSILSQARSGLFLPLLEAKETYAGGGGTITSRLQRCITSSE